ncbi:MAG TPA: hypothetical protein VGC79_00525 [Polyangiaceae bacterium]
MRKTKLWVAGGQDGRVLFIEKGAELCNFLQLDGETHSPRYHEALPEALAYYGCEPETEATMVSGEYYPRIYRGHYTPTLTELGPHSVATAVSAIRATRMLYAKLNTLFEAIEPRREPSGHIEAPWQELTFGLLQREIIILACTEVESAWKGVLLANGDYSERERPPSFNTSHYVKLLKPLRLDEWTVTLSSHHFYREISPFKGWSSEKNQTSKSLPWYDAYNAVKHGREQNIERATFAGAVDAVAAAFIMTVAQFGTEHLSDSAYFHPDLFSIRHSPIWLPTERYIPPCNMALTRGEWLGWPQWTPAFCPELEPSQVGA